MAKQLPKGWVETLLGNVTTIITGNTPSKKIPEYYGNKYPWVKPADANREEVLDSSEEYLSELGSTKARMLPVGAVMVTCIGNLGNVAIAGVTCATNQQINSIVDYTEKLNSKFLFYYAKRLKPWLIDNSTSTTISMVNKSVFSTVPFSFPPRAEQDRIVAKVDALMAQHAAIQQSMERIPQLLKEFRQQVLTQAVTGKLTEEWRVGKELEGWEETKERKKYREWILKLPLKWKMLPFYSVANIDANLVDPNKYLDYVLVAPNHIEKLTGQLIEKVLTRDIKPKSDKHLFKAGSIVYSKIRPYLSKLILTDFDGLCSADMYPISSEINIHYLFLFMKSAEFLNFATTAGERSVLPKINQKGLNQIPVPVPPLQEQQEIVRRVESLFEKATAIEQRYEQLKSQIDSLPQAILHKAFKGELVQQLDSDGSASELLKEIEEMRMDSKKRK